MMKINKTGIFTNYFYTNTNENEKNFGKLLQRFANQRISQARQRMLCPDFIENTRPTDEFVVSAFANKSG